MSNLFGLMTLRMGSSQKRKGSVSGQLDIAHKGVSCDFEKMGKRNSFDHGDDLACRVSAEYIAPRFTFGDLGKIRTGKTIESVNHYFQTVY